MLVTDTEAALDRLTPLSDFEDVITVVAVSEGVLLLWERVERLEAVVVGSNVPEVVKVRREYVRKREMLDEAVVLAE